MNELYASFPDNVEYKNNLAISYSKLGETHASLGNLEKALGFFEIFNQFMHELYESFPDNVGFKNGLAISYEKLGQTHASLGNLEKAFSLFEIQTKLFEELHTSFRDNVEYKNNLAISYSKLGDIYQKTGRADEALFFCKQYSGLFKELYEASSDNVSFVINYIKSLNAVGLYLLQQENEEGFTYFEEAERLTNLHKNLSEDLIEVQEMIALNKMTMGLHIGQNGDEEKGLTMLKESLATFQQLFNKTKKNQYQLIIRQFEALFNEEEGE